MEHWPGILRGLILQALQKLSLDFHPEGGRDATKHVKWKYDRGDSVGNGLSVSEMDAGVNV